MTHGEDKRQRRTSLLKPRRVQVPLPVTAVFAGLLALWLIVLQFKVVGFRRGKRVSLGDAGDEMGERLIRGHANAAENIPIFLILLGLAEGLGTPGWIVAALGTLFTVGRLMHGVHFFKIRKGFMLRFWGMIMTITAIGLTALGVIAHGVAAL